MNSSDRFDLFSQQVYFLSKIKNLIRLCKYSSRDKGSITSTIEEIENFMEKYSTDLNICSTCGHIIPSLPSLSLKERITPVMDSYLESQELNGVIEDIKDYFITPPTENYTPQEIIPSKPKINLPPQLASLGESNKIKVIKATLL